jgi:hypothetical protein
MKPCRYMLIFLLFALATANSYFPEITLSGHIYSASTSNKHYLFGLCVSEQERILYSLAPPKKNMWILVLIVTILTQTKPTKFPCKLPIKPPYSEQ